MREPGLVRSRQTTSGCGAASATSSTVTISAGGSTAAWSTKGSAIVGCSAGPAQPATNPAHNAASVLPCIGLLLLVNVVIRSHEQCARRERAERCARSHLDELSLRRA